MRINKTKILIAFILGVFILQSCTATKKDCRGRKKHRLSNGIYM